MTAKLFEIRDAGTFFPALAVKIEPANEAERYLIRRAGFALPCDLVYFAHCEDSKIQYDPYGWGNQIKTRFVAHQFIASHWNELESGEVIDVQFILGETTTKKISESNGAV